MDAKSKWPKLLLYTIDLKQQKNIGTATIPKTIIIVVIAKMPTIVAIATRPKMTKTLLLVQTWVDKNCPLNNKIVALDQLLL